MKNIDFRYSRIACACLAVALGGCAAERIHKEGMQLIESGYAEEGITKLAQAKNMKSDSAELRKDWLVERQKFVDQEIRTARDLLGKKQWVNSIVHFQNVLKIDVENAAAIQGIQEVAASQKVEARLDDAIRKIGSFDYEGAGKLVQDVLASYPGQTRALELQSRLDEIARRDLAAKPTLRLNGGKPVSLQFKDASLRMVMDALSKAAAVNVVFDKDVRNDLKVTIFVRDVPVEEAIDLILMQTQTAKKVLSSNTILVYPNSETKAHAYEELKVRRFELVNADPKQVLTMVKNITKTKDVFIDEKSNALTVRDTPDVIRLIEKMIGAMDQPESEVMLEIDVMEISRKRLQQLGIDLPTSFGLSTSGMTLAAFRAATAANVNVSGLAITATAQKTDSDINDLATPRIRVRNKEKAKFLVGDRLPIISTAAVPNTNSATPIYNTNIQYVDVGIKIEVEPTIYADGDVAIKLNLEVSTNSGQNSLAAQTGTIAYTISTRSMNTVLRLKDGQTELIGGLLQKRQHSDGTKIPGVGDIPVVGRLFGSQTDNNDKSEIIMSITPHIVRKSQTMFDNPLEVWSGTQDKVDFSDNVPASFRAPATPAVTGSKPAQK